MTVNAVKSKVRHRMGTRGSVLMEFVIVAPLYFLLLGGLFLIGDLSLNRIRMHIGDQLATWVGASRFCPVNPGVGKDRDSVDRLVALLFGKEVGAEIGADGKLKTDGVRWFDVEAYPVGDGNGFVQSFRGGVTKLPIKVPPWVSGMFNMQDMMTGGGTGARFVDPVFFGGDTYRSYVVHRLPVAGMDDDSEPPDDDCCNRSRKIPARDVVYAGYVGNVVSEGWSVIGGGSAPNALGVRKGRTPRKRYLREWGE